MAEEEKLLTEDEICEWLHISKECLLKLKRDPLDPLPYMKVGRRFLFDPEKVTKWGERQAKRYREALERCKAS